MGSEEHEGVCNSGDLSPTRRAKPRLHETKDMQKRMEGKEQ